MSQISSGEKNFTIKNTLGAIILFVLFVFVLMAFPLSFIYFIVAIIIFTTVIKVDKKVARFLIFFFFISWITTFEASIFLWVNDNLQVNELAKYMLCDSGEKLSGELFDFKRDNFPGWLCEDESGNKKEVDIYLSVTVFVLICAVIAFLVAETISAIIRSVVKNDKYGEMQNSGGAVVEFKKAKRTGAEITRDIQELLSKNKKIEAIKLYKEHAETGLKEAKEFIDSFDVNGGQIADNDIFSGSFNKFSGTDQNVIDKVKSLLYDGNKIEAVKYYSKHANVSLVEAKRFIDSL